MPAAERPPAPPVRKRQIIRIFTGQKTPEELLRALIRAHRT